MSGTSKYLSLTVLVLALVSVLWGSVFVYQGISKANMVKEAMRIEKVTYGLNEAAVARGEVIDSAEKAKEVADVVSEHRRSIASTYQDLLAGGKYDPTNPKHLTYAQALNMENYLYLGVLALGVTDIATAIGVFMVFTGVALGATGITLLKLTGRTT